MRKLVFIACCSLALLLTLNGCIHRKKQIKVQFINASPGSPYLDYYLQSTKRASFIGYNNCSNSNTADLLDGETCIAEARLNDNKITAVKFTDWRVGEHYTMITYNDYNNLRTALLRDTAIEPPAGKFLLRFMHFGTDAPALDVYMNNIPVALNKVYYGTDSLNAVGDYVELNAGTYTVSVKDHNTSQTLFSVPNMGIEDRRILNMYATGKLTDSLTLPFCLGYARQ